VVFRGARSGRGGARLRAGDGRKIWSRRLQGAPFHPAIVFGRRIAVVASNSVVYFLSVRSGSILAWENVPSRIVYEPARAGASLLVSPAADRLLVFDLRTGEPIGQHLFSGTLAAGAVWSSPFVVLVVEDAGSGRQRLVFLRSR
jgi:outer membrane protein assembly factor BamB